MDEHIDTLQTRNLRGPLLNEYFGSAVQRGDVGEIANEIHRRWLGRVDRETGNLAASGKVTFHRTRHAHDTRWEAEFSFGGPSAPYARAYEEQHHTLEAVLQEMGYYQGGTVGPTGRVSKSSRAPVVNVHDEASIVTSSLEDHVLRASEDLQRSRLDSRPGAERFRTLSELRERARQEGDTAAAAQANMTLRSYELRREARGLPPTPGAGE